MSSGTNTNIRALVYWGIPSDMRSRPEQSHHLPEGLLARWLQVANWVSDGCPPPPLPVIRKGCLGWLFVITFLDNGKKVWYLSKFNPSTAALIYEAPSTECAKPINRVTVVKGLRRVDYQLDDSTVHGIALTAQRHRCPFWRLQWHDT